MGFANFNQGLAAFGAPVLPGGGQIPYTGGKYFYVNGLIGQDIPGYGSKPDKPYDTIDYAIGKCTATSAAYPKQDVIIVMPGHTETISAAGGITCDVAGIFIIGLGSGSYRPVVTWSATASTWAVSAANVTISNILTTASIDEVVSMFNVTGANCTLDKVDFQPYGALGATGQVIQFLLTSAAADLITVQNCKHYQKTAANANQVWIDLNGVDYPRVINNVGMFTAKAATASHWIGTTAACNEVEIANNKVLFLGATITGVITCASGTTGLIYGNYLGSGTSVGITTAIVADTAFVFENYWIDDAAASGILTPAAGTD
jgi:hypothetical protein